MSKSHKTFWFIISALAFVLLLPLIILIGVLIATGIYIQIMKDFLNEEFNQGEEDTGESSDNFEPTAEDY